ncbi:MAG TPA: FAD-binding oxidoreductase [Acidobacteriaceae bacterium]|jgi:FAD/FMN-containing dehydrogenase|nr:FAD-binding oxidoreductase [Acidobacteriaceae bacterium]
MQAKQKPPAFESWGRYPQVECELRSLHWASDFPPRGDLPQALLPVGMGRSYGDVCLLEGGTLFSTVGLNRLLSFDVQTGLLRCESGVTLAEILNFAVPLGWFLPVTPGTKYVTVGGAIANDIHGKNHHVAGTFGCHVPRFELVRSDGTRMICSADQNPEWFAATIGGMGLTGFIPWAEVQLRPIVSRNICYEGVCFHGLDEFLALSAGSSRVEYTVAWIDCVSRGRNFARGIYMQGDHSQIPDPLKPTPDPRLLVPFDLPGWVLNRASMRIFNGVYYHKQLRRHVSTLMDYEPFFYPLDKVLHWNRIYGQRGFLQFQCVVPFANGRDGMLEILKAIADSGLGSFLAVLKVMGEPESPGLMSFPMPGITLALDIPIHPGVTFPLFDRLAEMTRELGGRLYPAKDARMTATQFQTFYPQWQQLAAYRDPAFSSSFWERVTTHG